MSLDTKAVLYLPAVACAPLGTTVRGACAASILYPTNHRRACPARVGSCVVCLSVRLSVVFLPPRATGQQKSDTKRFSATLA